MKRLFKNFNQSEGQDHTTSYKFRTKMLFFIVPKGSKGVLKDDEDICNRHRRRLGETLTGQIWDHLGIQLKGNKRL